MTTQVSEISVDSSQLPSSDAVITTVIRFHLAELLRTATIDLAKGRLSVKGALVGHPSDKRLFMGFEALDFIECMMIWPMDDATSTQGLVRSDKLQAKIREVLQGCPEAEVLRTNGLVVQIDRYGAFEQTRFKAYIREGMAKEA
ncbi:MAG: hypothetical protein WBP12_05920 [Candidatus Saccharimonas sp.]